MTYASQIDATELLPLTVRVPPAYTSLIRAYANYIRAQTTWDAAYVTTIDSVDQKMQLHEIASRNMRTLPSPNDLLARHREAAKLVGQVDKLRSKLLSAAHAHYVETRTLAEQLNWMHDRTSIDAIALAAKRIANVYMCAALLEYEGALNEGSFYGMWTPEFRLPMSGEPKQ